MTDFFCQQVHQLYNTDINLDLDKDITGLLTAFEIRFLLILSKPGIKPESEGEASGTASVCTVYMQRNMAEKKGFIADKIFLIQEKKLQCTI